jgi:O-antigen ligase
LFFSKQIFLLIKLTLVNKFLSLEASTEESRLDIWKATINALTSDIRHIIFGVSEGGLPSVSGSSWPMVSSSNPHNMLLYFWQATGLAGLVLIICIVWLCAYFIHRNNKLHQIIFYWLFLSSLVFVGFGFYDDGTRTDLLNIGIVVAFSLLLRKQDSKLPSRASAFNQDSSRFNESYS